MPDTRLTISQFAERIGVHPATLRGWDKKGILTPAIRSPGGTRYYTEDQVADFKARYADKRPMAAPRNAPRIKGTPDVILKLTQVAEDAGADPKKFLHELSQRPDILNT